MYPGRFMWFAWATGDPMNFNVLQCHADPKSRSRVLHRGTVVPRYFNSVGYNSSLQPNSDAYFPVEKPLDGIDGKSLPSAALEIVNPPNNGIAEGGRKRNVPLSTTA